MTKLDLNKKTEIIGFIKTYKFYILGLITIAGLFGFMGGLATYNSSLSEEDYNSALNKVSTMENQLELYKKSEEEFENEIKTLNSKLSEASLFLNLDAENKAMIMARIEEINKQKQIELDKKLQLEEEERVRKQEEDAKKEAEEQAIKDAQSVDIDSVKQISQSIINKEIGDSILNTTLDLVRVNENLGTDYNKDVIVLADLSWSTKNSEKMTREMLQMYSDHLAVKLSSELENGSEIALFWDAEYTGLNIKHSYYIKNGNAYKQ